MSKITYLNSDLELKSTSSFDDLNKFLDEDGAWSLHYDQDCDQGKTRGWHGIYEIDNHYDTPNETLKEFLSLLLKMDEKSESQWNKCSIREFDIGYECGKEPRTYKNEIPCSILETLTELNIGLRITIYSGEPPKQETTHSSDL